MKGIKYFAVLSIFLVSGLSGCAAAENPSETVTFEYYDLKTDLPKIEYRICHSDEDVTVYFPVVTSKEITETEFGGVAAEFLPAQEKIRIRLQSTLQDRCNLPCDGGYLSFLKYKVMIEGKEQLRQNDTITLFDTSLWICHDSEWKKIVFTEDYLQITIVGEDERISPDWEGIVADFQTKIQTNDDIFEK